MYRICFVCGDGFEVKNDREGISFFTDEKGDIFEYICCVECETKMNEIIRDQVKKLREERGLN